MPLNWPLVVCPRPNLSHVGVVRFPPQKSDEIHERERKLRIRNFNFMVEDASEGVFGKIIKLKYHFFSKIIYNEDVK